MAGTDQTHGQSLPFPPAGLGLLSPLLAFALRILCSGQAGLLCLGHEAICKFFLPSCQLKFDLIGRMHEWD